MRARPLLPAALLLALAPGARAERGGPPPPLAAPFGFNGHVVVRVETRTVIATALPLRWRERRGPRCLPTGAVQGAAVVVPQAVDFILRGGQRVRARFGGSCPGLAFYSGFYVVPHPDGQMCAGRDSVRDRAGTDCAISRLKTLEPAAP